MQGLKDRDRDTVKCVDRRFKLVVGPRRRILTCASHGRRHGVNTRVSKGIFRRHNRRHQLLRGCPGSLPGVREPTHSLHGRRSCCGAISQPLSSGVHGPDLPAVLLSRVRGCLPAVARRCTLSHQSNHPGCHLGYERHNGAGAGPRSLQRSAHAQLCVARCWIRRLVGAVL